MDSIPTISTYEEVVDALMDVGLTYDEAEDLIDEEGMQDLF